jgi:hypothetical protein
MHVGILVCLFECRYIVQAQNANGARPRYSDAKLANMVVMYLGGRHETSEVSQRDGAVCDMSTCEHGGDRTARTICQSVDLGGTPRR